jgi:hypothetical protein
MTLAALAPMGGKTAITSILKQEWCGSVACDLLSGIKILNILK